MNQAISTAFLAISLLFCGLFSGGAAAQDRVWLQVEAQPNLRGAEDRARAYSGAFANVYGFQLSSGWYAIVIGPVAAVEAEGRLADLRGRGQIPGDSFVADGANFRQQFWPVGQNIAPLTEPLAVTNAIPDPVETSPLDPVSELAAAEPAAVVEPVVQVLPEETPAEARRSEGDMPREDRELIQTAMAWGGFYASSIDGDFGPGTRNAMATYQQAMGYDATGILTTRQRDELIGRYRADLASLGLETVRENTAGIEMQLPTALVAFDHYDPPFVHFKQKNDSGVSVILISQAGDQNSLFGLYDIMQTLEIVPPNGERQRSSSSFTLTGQSATLNSYTYAALQGGLVKGYTLAWKPQDDAKMARVLAAMTASFAPFGDRAMDDTVIAPTDEQRRGMLAGLEVRRPDFSRSGFYIDAQGSVLTTAEAVKQCGRITLDEATDATVTMVDDALGIAVLKPVTALSPAAFAQFQTATPRLQSEIAVGGYSYEDAMSLPTVTFGTLEDLRGLEGEANLRRLGVKVLPGDAGGAVLDSSGAALGMLLPRASDSARVLPGDVNFAADAQSITQALSGAGVPVSASTRSGGMPPEDLAALASSVTVLVSCWN